MGRPPPAQHHLRRVSILRPTSPFRRGTTIRRAWQAFTAIPDADSLRAVRPVREHPGKMWALEGGLMRPLLPQPEGEIPTHVDRRERGGLA